MKVLPDSVAQALPQAGPDRAAMLLAVEAARRGELDTEVRIGVGPTGGVVPARVLGYARRVADSLPLVEAIIHRAVDRVVIFSSGPKVGQVDAAMNLSATAALGGALRIAGVEAPMTLDCADADQEVPDDLEVELPSGLEAWIRAAAARHGGPPTYAVDHASATMFGDLVHGERAPLRVTVGGRTEAKFWAVRKRVRAAALKRSMRLAPAFGLILKAAKVPWYYLNFYEPTLAEFATDPMRALEKLNAAANPKVGGNPGLLAEVRSIRGFSKVEEIHRLATALGGIKDMVPYAADMRLSFGNNLSKVLP